MLVRCKFLRRSTFLSKEKDTGESYRWWFLPLRYLADRLSTLNRLYSKLAFQVGDGAAVCVCSRASEEDSRTNIGVTGRIIRFVASKMDVVRQYINTPERAKREKEVWSKGSELETKVLGSRKMKMMYLDLIVADPALQGKGYGSALMRHANALADAKNCAVWLHSSDLGNTAFYNAMGYVKAGEWSLGDDNPSWNGPPIVLYLMIREAKGDRK